MKLDPPVLGAEDADVDVVDDTPRFDVGAMEFVTVVVPLDTGPLAVLAELVNVLAVLAELLAVIADVLDGLAGVLDEFVFPLTETLEFARSALKGAEAVWPVDAPALV
ncbi:MAG: hypothetical protein ABI353_18670 [Isosphaeraceae bacterium]